MIEKFGKEWAFNLDKLDIWMDYRNQTKSFKKSEAMEAMEKARNILAKENKSKTFVGMGLNRPGTLIALENDTIYLIGSVNEDGCAGSGYSGIIKPETIVKSYAVLLEI